MESRLVQEGELYEGRSSMKLDTPGDFYGSKCTIKVLCSGALWHYPAFSTIRLFCAIRDENVDEGIKLVAVSQEEHRELCFKYRLMVGPPVIMAWKEKKALLFERKNVKEPSNKVYGPFNGRQLINILDAIKESADYENVVLKF